MQYNIINTILYNIHMIYNINMYMESVFISLYTMGIPLYTMAYHCIPCLYTVVYADVKIMMVV